jgi:maltooligosyltrehalose trehalohydrolase
LTARLYREDSLAGFKFELDLGASVINRDAVRFRVWAPRAKKLSVRIITEGGSRNTGLSKDSWGYYEGIIPAREGDRYYFVLNNATERPDPASRFQPEGIHGPSQIVNPSGFIWEDRQWKGLPLTEFIIYELHVGTFTREGTFDAAISHLDHLKDLGVTAVELMPVCQFPGDRNWGYDEVCPFAPQNTYGGPTALKRLINACHHEGLAVVLDVVYNHLGPEGNYLMSFTPDYFTDRYKTPWGHAINFDGPLSDHVRHYFLSNALYWITEYHVDALRLDAIQGVFDFSAHHLLKELADKVHQLTSTVGRKFYLFAESDLNDVKIIDPPEIGGYGLDAVWNDDFHHALHTLVKPEKRAYYQDFGQLSHMAKALTEGFVYSGQYSPNRRRKHGNSSRERPARQFIVFSQSHDQVANSMVRPALNESLEQLKLRAAMAILSPYLPLLFMGEEYGEKAPFNYFTSHLDQGLVQKVRESRIKEFRDLWHEEPPDPQAEETFLHSKIGIDRPRSIEQDRLYDFYRTIIKLRKEIPVLARPSKEQIEVRILEDEGMLLERRWIGGSSVFFIFNFKDSVLESKLEVPHGIWEKVLDSSASEWGGYGPRAPEVIALDGNQVSVEMNRHSAALYRLIDVRGAT